MTTATAPPQHDPTWPFPPGFVAPDHLTLPETDGTFVQNFQEHPQSMLLTDAIRPILDQRHPDGQYTIGQDSGVYWNLTASLSDTPVRGATAPDWFYVPGVPPLIDGQIRRSYVMWQEIIAPLIVIEFVSGTGAEERDYTPISGKFWIYEQAIRSPYYAIYEVKPGKVELYQLITGQYKPVPPNEHRHYPVELLGVALGIWQGEYQNCNLPWLRWYDLEGNLLPSSEERAEQERLRAEQERLRAEAEALRAEAEALRAEAEAQRAEQERLRAEAEALRAEAEALRAERLAAKLRALGIDPESE